MAFSAADTVSRAPGAIYAELDRDCILVDVEAGKYLQLNPVGAEIWKTLAAPVLVGELCRRLHARFDAPPETIDADVMAFLEKLEARGMLTKNAAP